MYPSCQMASRVSRVDKFDAYTVESDLTRAQSSP